MKKVIRQFTSLTFGCLLIQAAIFTGCGGDQVETIVVDESQKEDVIEITASQFSSSGMKMGRISRELFSESINCNGVFDVPPPYRASVSVFYGGYVKEIFHLPGQRVSKGEVLMTMENPLFIQMQEDFLDAQSKLTYLSGDLERQKALLSDKAVSEKQYALVLSQYESTRARLEGLRKKLRLIHINPDELTADKIASSITVTSPINGYITEINVSKGMYIEAASPAFKILNNEHMHLELVIFESDAGRIREEQLVEFRLPGEKELHYARVHLSGKTVDPEKRSVNIHCHLENESESAGYIPGMFVEARILVNSDSSLALPTSAIVEMGSEYYVLRKKAETDGLIQFEQLQVKVGKTENELTELIGAEAFSAQDEFLSKGAFGLIAEE